jgi:acyl-CoA thioester hydrolase
VSAFTATVTAEADDIDELGHVNNAVWVQWIEKVARAHWAAAGDPAHVDAYLWVITRHEIDYLKPLRDSETVTARTWAEGPPKGARSVRAMEFAAADGTIHVRSRTEWVMIDRASGRPQRVTPEVIAPFLP